MKSHLISGLYAITPQTENTDFLVEKIEILLSLGVNLFQYRNKISSFDKKKEQVGLISKVIRSKGGIFIVNDSIELAKQCNADGVHLGRYDAELKYARESLSKFAIIGASCYNQIDLALEAYQNRADYVAFGSFFNSTTKPSASKANLRVIKLFKDQVNMPVVGIGGINIENAESVIRAGADSIAISGGLFNSPNLEKAVITFIKLIRKNKS